MPRAIVKLEIQWDTDKCNYKANGAGLFRDLQDFFKEKGKVLESIDVIGDSGVKVLELYDMVSQPLTITPKNEPGRPLSVKGKLNSMAPIKESAPSKDFQKGKFLPRKGYLKRELTQPK